MTKDEIIEMAKQSGAMFDHMTWVERDLLPVFERFAKLVAEKEREACAKLCDAFQARDVGMQPAECAGAIRARGSV
jgi:hypothetical protein